MKLSMNIDITARPANGIEGGGYHDAAMIGRHDVYADFIMT